MSAHTVDLIMVSYNSRRDLPTFFRSLLLNTEHPYRLYVIDNNSIDGSVAYLQTILKLKFFKENMKLTLNSTNIGLAKAWNQAVAQGKNKYIVFLNPDLVFTKNWLTKLVDSAKRHRKVMIVGVKVLNPDDTIYHAGSISKPRGKGLPNAKGLFAQEEKVRSIQGSCFLVKRKAFKKVGSFDEQFFVYGEEVDFCRQVRRAGYKVLYSPVPIYHFRHGSAIPPEVRSSLRRTSSKLLKAKWKKK